VKSHLIDTQSILSVSAESFTKRNQVIGHWLAFATDHWPPTTLHSSLSTIHSSAIRAAVPDDGASHEGRNRGLFQTSFGVPDE